MGPVLSPYKVSEGQGYYRPRPFVYTPRGGEWPSESIALNEKVKRSKKSKGGDSSIPGNFSRCCRNILTQTGPDVLTLTTGVAFFLSHRAFALHFKDLSFFLSPLFLLSLSPNHSFSPSLPLSLPPSLPPSSPLSPPLSPPWKRSSLTAAFNCRLLWARGYLSIHHETR